MKDILSQDGMILSNYNSDALIGVVKSTLSQIGINADYSYNDFGNNNGTYVIRQTLKKQSDNSGIMSFLRDFDNKDGSTGL